MIVDLTPSQVMALSTILLETIQRPGHTEVHVDVMRQVETRPEDLLRLFVDLGTGLPLICIRARWHLVGRHVRCRVFTRQPPGETWANVGSLVFGEDEWPAAREVLAPAIEILHDTDDAPCAG